MAAAKRSGCVFFIRPSPEAVPFWPVDPEAQRKAISPLLSGAALRGFAAHATRINDMGVDLPCPRIIVFTPHEHCTIASGFSVDLGVQVVCLEAQADITAPPVTVGYLMAPRSSLSKTKLRLANGVGVIDPTYRGPLKARFDILPGEDDQRVCPGDALLQILTPDGGGANYVVVGDDAPRNLLALFDVKSTARGGGGFGSTGARGTTGRAVAGGGAGGADDSVAAAAP
jgi:dUTP pyrophosphatase